MRLSRLDLTRYGKFTDYRIDFGECAPGAPDLHIIYGPNEAGKSTSLAAFLDLLFGIETQSPYNFLHPYQSMQIGGALEINGAVHELVRVKARHNDLLDKAGQPVDGGVLAGALSGIGREAYQTMFSLDDETLEAGGKSILASKGDLGQLLFSASAGLADLSQALTMLRAEADGFYKTRARSGELAELKKQFADLKEKKDAIDILASTYANLVLAREQAGVAYDEAMALRTQTRTRMDEVQRLLDGLPRLAAIQRLREQIDSVSDLPEPPVEWAAELAGLMQNETRFSTQLAGLKGEIERMDDEIEAIAVDEPARLLGPRIKAFADARARYVTAAKDLPERALSLRALDTEIGFILQRLGRPGHADPQALVLPASIIGRLRGLIESRSGVDTTLHASRREFLRTEEEFAQAHEKLKALGADAGQDDGAFHGLSRAIRDGRHANWTSALRLAETGRVEQVELLNERLIALAPWHGDGEALAALAVPEAAQIALWRSSLNEIGKRRDALGRELEQAITSQRIGEAELAALRAASGAIADDEAEKTRQARQAAWSAHRSALETKTADAFEAALERDDALRDARLRQSSDLARLRQAEHQLATNAAAIARASELHEAASSELESMSAQIRAAIAPLLMPPETIPAEMLLIQLEGWLKRRADALEARQALQRAEKELAGIARDAETARVKLAEAMQAADIACDHTESLETLLDLAEARLEAETRRHAAAKAARERFESCEADLKMRARALKSAEEAEYRWHAEWAAALAQCWLGEAEPLPALAPVREILTEIASLGPALEKRDQLVDRIVKMERDEAEFVADIGALMAELDEAFDESRVLAHADALEERAERARRDHLNRSGKLAAREDAEQRLQDITQLLALHEARKAELTGFFDVESLNEVSEKFEMVRARHQSRARMAELERELVAGLRLSSLAEAEAILAGLDAQALAGEAADLDGRFQDLDQRTRQLYAARSKASDEVEAVGGDDAVAKLNEQRQTLLLDIEDKALAHLRLRVGALAAEQALRAYRDKHRSSMMERASEAFRIISRGAYSGLAARPEKDSEVLIGLAQGGGSKLAAEMSKGTRFQLYLALRVAGYYEFAQTRQPVPFFADDIMETFDDFRAEEAFRLFAEMAGVGQVIYLTHHRHLCDIAKAVCPGAKVHELMASA